jgi:hypothetical protein
MAQGRLRGAVRRGPARRAARRVDPVLPVQPGRPAAHPRAGPRRPADRDPARSGGAGALELDAPVVGGPRSRRRLRRCLRRGGAPDRGGLGGLLALHGARALRRAARASVHGVPQGAGPRVPLPRADRESCPGPRPDLRVPRRARRRAHRRAAGERHRPPAAVAPAPGRVPGAARQHRGQHGPAGHGRRDRHAGTDPAARQPAAARADLGPAAGADPPVRGGHQASGGHHRRGLR